MDISLYGSLNSKLKSVASGIKNITFENGILIFTTNDDKIINVTVPNMHLHSNKNILDKFTVVDGKLYYDGRDLEVECHEHVNKNVLDGITSVKVSEWNNKVDKANGKSLIDDTEIERLKNIVSYDDTDVKASIPTKISQLTNDSDYATENFVTNKIAEASLGGGSGEVDLSGYQTKTDNSLSTTAKTIVGAINENKSSLDDMATKIENIQTGETTLDTIEGVQNHNQENLFDASGCEDFFYDYEGNQTTALNGSVMSNWISCKAKDKITRNGTATNVVCYFDSNKNFISRVDSFGLATIEVPNNSNIAYVRMAVQIEDGRKIAFGTYIVPDNEVGEYHMIPTLKVNEENLTFTIGLVTSPDGTQWKIKVDNNGVLSTENISGIITDANLPTDFAKYTVTGESANSDDFLVCPHTDNNSMGYIFVMNYKGQVKWYKKLPAFAYNFRKYKNANGEYRYTYIQVDNSKYPKPSTNGGYDMGYIVVMDENFNEIATDVTLLQGGSITESKWGVENHDYIFIDDGHYILSGIYPKLVTNIPSQSGAETRVLASIIQEVKDGQVVWQWESTDCEELYSASTYNNNYGSFTGIGTNYTDYSHLNSIQLDKNTGDLLVSLRSCGILKINKITKEIMWLIGRGTIASNLQISNITISQTPSYQHDARYSTIDNSITCFDNEGCASNNVRICRYKIDEVNKTLTSFNEYKTTYARSGYMGSAYEVSKDVFDIAYGSGWTNIAFEEYDFNKNKQNILVVGNGYDLYRIFKGYEDNNFTIVEANPCTSITLSSNTLTFTDNTSQTLTYTVEPSGTTDTVSWYVEPSGYINVNNGTVTPIINGECVVTVKCGNQSDTCNVSVNLESGDIPENANLITLTNFSENKGIDVSGIVIDGADIVSDIINVKNGVYIFDTNSKAWGGYALYDEDMSFVSIENGTAVLNKLYSIKNVAYCRIKASANGTNDMCLFNVISSKLNLSEFISGELPVVGSANTSSNASDGYYNINTNVVEGDVVYLFADKLIGSNNWFGIITYDNDGNCISLNDKNLSATDVNGLNKYVVPNGVSKINIKCSITNSESADIYVFIKN